MDAWRGALAAVALPAAASPASATVIFSDDFDANALGLLFTELLAAAERPAAPATP